MLNQGTTAERPAPPVREWYEELSTPSSVAIAGGQNPSARLIVKFRLYSYRADALPHTPVEKYFLVTLDGSTVNPGRLLYDRPDKRGFYTEGVEVTMAFTDTDALKIRHDQPSSSGEGGSTSNSINLTLGAGFFGETPTANVGGSIGNTITESLPDFEVINQSDDRTVVHDLRLCLIRRNVYRNPTDLVDPSSLTSTLSPLPARAVSNMPLISQALFHAPNGLETLATLRIGITHRLVCVEKTVAPLEVVAPVTAGKNVGYDPGKRDVPQKVHRAGLYIYVEPLVAPYVWEFPIAFGDVR